MGINIDAEGWHRDEMSALDRALNSQKRWVVSSNMIRLKKH